MWHKNYNFNITFQIWMFLRNKLIILSLFSTKQKKIHFGMKALNKVWSVHAKKTHRLMCERPINHQVRRKLPVLFCVEITQKSLTQSGQRMSSLLVRKPRPTRDTQQRLQLKQSLCHWRCSNEMYLLPPRPETKATKRGHKMSFYSTVSRSL